MVDVLRVACSARLTFGGGRFPHRYVLQSRPLLVRNLLPLRERCPFAMASPISRTYPKKECGRTAYPSLTGQQPCGRFSIPDLNKHPACTDAEKTRPVCALKPRRGSGAEHLTPGLDPVNASKMWRAMPAPFRYEDLVPPVPGMAKTWVRAPLPSALLLRS